MKNYVGTIGGSVTGVVTSLTRPTPDKLVIKYRTTDFGEGSATLISCGGGSTPRSLRG